MFQVLKDYYNSINGDIVRVCTFGTETSKSAIQTACRGLQINNDVGMYLSSLIPVERGKVWGIHDCYYGDEKLDRKPVKEFVKIVDEYNDSKNLLEVVLGIEGLINRRSSHPCFDAETLVTTFEGLKRIADVTEGDLVLTHEGRFKPVMELQVSNAEEIYTVQAKSSFPIETTGNHPFYVRERTDKGRIKNFSKPKWKEASKLKIGSDYLGIPINNESVIPIRNNIKLPFDNKDFWWVIGRFLGDGWTLRLEHFNKGKLSSIEKNTIICCDKRDDFEKEEIIQHLERVGFDYRVTVERTVYRIYIKNQYIYEYLQEFGKYAHGKFLNKDVLNLPNYLLEGFFDGYLSADGHYCKSKNYYDFKTVSKKLAIGLMQVVNKLYKKHTTLTIIPPEVSYIEGRKVDCKEKYNVRFTKGIKKKEQSFYEDGYIWTKVSHAEKRFHSQKVYNLTVLDDSSYVVHGICVHNCGSLIVNQAFTNHNALMRGASGELISQFDLSDSELMGGIKYDLLCTKVASMIQITLEMLLKNNKVQWQGSLRETYNKYLHPDIIDRESLTMWEKLNKGQLLSAFQFEGGVGEQAIKLIQPTTMKQAVDGNNLMRLASEDGKEQPLNMFVRYKNNIEEWYNDMRDFGLNEEEIQICIKLLAEDFGVCNTQEKMMLISLDEEVSAFDVPTSNVLRKGVSKKKGEMYEKAHKLFYEKGRENGCRDILLDYLWDVQIAMQKGYGFSVIHGVEYTYILIQQLNLIEYYPSVYWNTAVLMVESGALELEEAEEQEVKGKEKTTNYGEVAKAIGNLQSKGVKISLPYINKAEQGFIPNEENNEIVFGLKGVMSVNNETSQLIIENRPYTSLEDFHSRMVMVKREKTLSTGRTQMKSLVSESQTITLIKAGAFDLVENKPREVILEEYLKRLFPFKAKLTTKDIGKISELGLLPIDFKDTMRYYNFREYLMSFEKFKDKDSKSINWCKVQGETDSDTDYTIQFFLEHFSNDMQEGRDYKYNEEGVLCIALGTPRKGSFDSVYGAKILPMTQWLTTTECRDMYNQVIFDNVKREYMSGSVNRWEMEAMNFYSQKDGHELINVKREDYDIVDFNELSEEPTVIGFTKYKNLQYPKFELHRIVGTVLDRDKNKHSVSLLTPTGVVNVKFYAGQFGFYDRTISKEVGLDAKGKMKKVVLEDGWFKRGELLLITGFRRGETFKPKRYSNSIYQHTVSKISEIKEDGTLVLVNERAQIVE